MYFFCLNCFVRIPRLKNCPLTTENDLKRPYRVEISSNIIAVKWYDNKAVTLISSFSGIDSITEISKYDFSAHEKVAVNKSNILKVYNTFTGGVDKLDMVCSLYKQSIRSRRWYVYIRLHSIIIIVAIAWIVLQ